MRFLTVLFLAMSFGVGLQACSSCGEQAPPDKDGKRPKNEEEQDKLAKTPAGLEIEDSLDAASDKADFRVVKPDEKGKGKLAWEFDGKVTGKVGVTNLDGDDIASEDVTDDESKYEVEWDVEEGKTYLAYAQVSKGKAKYTLNFSVTPPKPIDLCEGKDCGEDSKCDPATGNCIEDKPPECSPKCTGGKTCVNGECVAPCGGRCPKDQICNRRTNECVRDPCAGKTCPAGERCVGGTCKAPPPATCSPACKDNQTCEGTKCVNKPAPSCNPPCGDGEVCQGTACVKQEIKLCGPVGAGVIQVIPNGGGSIVILNKGATQNVKVGQSGKIANVGPSFKITEVYPVRSKAVIDADAATIGNNKGATIQREACP